MWLAVVAVSPEYFLFVKVGDRSVVWQGSFFAGSGHMIDISAASAVARFFFCR